MSDLPNDWAGNDATCIELHAAMSVKADGLPERADEVPGQSEPVLSTQIQRHLGSLLAAVYVLARHPVLIILDRGGPWPGCGIQPLAKPDRYVVVGEHAQLQFLIRRSGRYRGREGHGGCAHHQGAGG